MKKNYNLIPLLTMLGLVSGTSLSYSQTTETWDGGGGDDNWSTNNNWADNNALSSNAIINFAGSTRTSPNNDVSGYGGYRIFFNSGASAFTLGGNALTLYDFGGNAPKIENNSTNTQTINLNVTVDGAGTGGSAEINPVSGALTMGGSVTLADTTVLNVWGSNTVTYSQGITASTYGTLVLNQSTTTILQGTSNFGGENNLANGNGNIAIGSSPSGSGATLTVSGTVNGVDNTSLQKGTFNLQTGGTYNTVRFVSSDASGATNTINQTGGTMNITGNVNSGTSSSFLLGHWNAASVYNLSGGTLNAPNAPLLLGWDGQATVNQTGGTANLLGINFNNGRNSTALYDVTSGATLNIGTYGMNGNASNKTMRLSGGTLGAYADWTGTQSIQLASTSTIHTLDSVDNTTARAITLNNEIWGTGGLTKTGAGTLYLNGTGDTYSGATVVNGGTLQINNTVRNSSDFTANTGAILELNATNMFVGGHGVALADSKTLNANGGTLLMSGSFDSRFGNVNLSNGATWTSNRGLTAWDALLANVASGAATVSVTGTGKSLMNGSGGIHMQGQQNFNVADTVTGTGVDLEVTMRLDNAGNAGGTGSLRKIGTGTMLLNGQMTYTGGTVVDAGILAVDGNQAFNRLSNNHAVTVNNTGTFEIRGVNALPSATSGVDITVNTGGIFNVVSGGSTAIGAGGTSHAHIRNLTLNGGTVDMTYSGAGSAYNGESVQLNGDITVGGSTASIISSSTTTALSGLALAGPRNITVADVTGSSAVDLTISAELENTDTSPADDGFVKLGLGTLLLSNANSYSGGTKLSDGTILVGNDSSLGTGSLTIDFAANNQTKVIASADGTAHTLANALNLSTPASDDNNNRLTIGQASGGTGSLTFSGDVTLGADTSSTQDARILQVIGNHTISGAISATGTNVYLVKQNTGTLTLSGANTFAGNLVIDEGRVKLSGGSLAAGDLFIGGGLSGTTGWDASLELSTATSYPRDVIVQNFGGTGGARELIFSNTTGTASLTGTVALEKVLTVSGAGNGLLSGDTSGSGGFLKTDSGTLTLSGTNSYSGTTTVNGGNLVINGNQSTASGAVTIGGASASNSPTLYGTGTIGGATTISSASGGADGTHSAGAEGNGVGVQTFSDDLTYQSGSLFQWDLASSTLGTRGTDYDGVTVDGTLGGSSSTFKVVLGAGAFSDAFWATTRTWSNIFTDSSSSALNMASIFGSVQWFEGNTNMTGSTSAYGSFSIVGSDLIWTAVPESSNLLVGILLGARMIRRERRKVSV